MQRSHVVPDMPLTRSLVADTVLESSDAIVASDRDGIVRFWNSGAERMFGYGAADALGQSLDIIIPERLRARHWEGYRQVMITGQSRYSAGELLAVPAIRKDGAQISVEFTITPIHGSLGELVGLLAVMRDVTARFNETKQLRQKLRALESAARQEFRAGPFFLSF
jgi:PAS domain S-box-containing protein